MKQRRVFLSLCCITAVTLAVSAIDARGDVVYSQGFETDTSGWLSTTVTPPTRVPSGTNGIASASGGHHAEATVGNYTRWGGYNSATAAAGYQTSLDIYLDTAGGFANDTRFDFSSAINKADGTFLRDFVFNGGFYNDASAPGTGNRFVFSASNNAGRANSFPKNPGRDPFAITSSGWYTFEHSFYDNAGTLAVDLTIKDSGGSSLHQWTVNTSDLMANVGGNRYGFIASNEFPFLAIDNAELTTAAVVPVPLAAYAGGALFGVLGISRWRGRRAASA